MPIDITVPRLGWSMDEGTFAEWLKQHGEHVRNGDMLFVLEGDKAAQEVECFDEGRLFLTPSSPKPGDVVKVGQLLAQLLTEPEWAAATATAAASTAAASTAPAVSGAAAVAVTPQVPEVASSVSFESPAAVPVVSPALRRLARELNVDLRTVVGTGAGGRIQEDDIRRQSHISAGGMQSVPRTASPRALRTAAALGIDWTTLTGSGRSGRISERDVLQAAKGMGVSASASESHGADVSAAVPSNVPSDSSPSIQALNNPAATPPAAASIDEASSVHSAEVQVRSSQPRQSAEPASATPSSDNATTSGSSAAAVSGNRSEQTPAASAGPLNHRRTIASRMMESHLTTAPVTLSTTVDMTNLVSLRTQFRAVSAATGVPIPGFTDFVIKLVSLTLREHPAMNSRWDADGVSPNNDIHVGIAVDTDSGLVVPVIRHADQLSVRRLSQQSRDLIDRARARRLTAAEMQQGTFTVTNLGALGIDVFTPIINIPQCAVLGMGRILRQPVVVDDQIVIRDMMTLSLTFDHRIVDGAPAARFLQSLSRAIENPAQYLID
jgi:pyruvate dehydrogenase E2 component (dihydrolipoamide acetyltransferase)